MKKNPKKNSAKVSYLCPPPATPDNFDSPLRIMHNHETQNIKTLFDADMAKFERGWRKRKGTTAELYQHALNLALCLIGRTVYVGCIDGNRGGKITPRINKYIVRDVAFGRIYADCPTLDKVGMYWGVQLTCQYVNHPENYPLVTVHPRKAYFNAPSAAQDCEAELRKWLSNSSREYHLGEYQRYIKEDTDIGVLANICNEMFAGKRSCEKYIRARY